MAQRSQYVIQPYQQDLVQNLDNAVKNVLKSPKQKQTRRKRCKSLTKKNQVDGKEMRKSLGSEIKTIQTQTVQNKANNFQKTLASKYKYSPYLFQFIFLFGIFELLKISQLNFQYRNQKSAGRIRLLLVLRRRLKKQEKNGFKIGMSVAYGLAQKLVARNQKQSTGQRLKNQSLSLKNQSTLSLSTKLQLSSQCKSLYIVKIILEVQMDRDQIKVAIFSSLTSLAVSSLLFYIFDDTKESTLNQKKFNELLISIINRVQVEGEQIKSVYDKKRKELFKKDSKQYQDVSLAFFNDIDNLATKITKEQIERFNFTMAEFKLSCFEFMNNSTVSGLLNAANGGLVELQNVDNIPNEQCQKIVQYYTQICVNVLNNDFKQEDLYMIDATAQDEVSLKFQLSYSEIEAAMVKYSTNFPYKVRQLYKDIQDKADQLRMQPDEQSKMILLQIFDQSIELNKEKLGAIKLQYLKERKQIKDDEKYKNYIFYTNQVLRQTIFQSLYITAQSIGINQETFDGLMNLYAEDPQVLSALKTFQAQSSYFGADCPQSLTAEKLVELTVK